MEEIAGHVLSRLLLWVYDDVRPDTLQRLPVQRRAGPRDECTGCPCS